MESSATRRTYDYSVFGLHLRSDLPLPELAALEPDPSACPTVTIRYGDAGPSLAVNPDGPTFLASHDDYRHEFANAARYRVHHGSEIIVTPLGIASPDAIRSFLLGTGLAVLCHQRGLFPMHASAIDVDGCAVAFSGASGTGKSSLLEFFHQKGYRTLADDVCVVSVEASGRPYVAPGIPRIKTPQGDGLPKAEVRTGWDARHRSVPLDRVYILPEPSDVSETRIEMLGGVAAFEAVVESTFRPHVVAPLGLAAGHFARSLSISQRARIFAVRWRRGVATFPEHARALEQHLQGTVGAPR